VTPETRKVGQAFWSIFAVLLTLMVVVLIGASAAQRNNVTYHWTEMRVVNRAVVQINDQIPFEASLPYLVENANPGDVIVVTSEVDTAIYDNMLFRVNGASLNIYIDEQLYLSTGQPNSYPGFQRTPSPQISMLDLPTVDSVKLFRFECTVGDVIHRLELSEFYVGDTAIIFINMLRNSGLSFMVAFMLLLAGVVLMAVSIMSIRATSAASAMVWLGLSCLFFGLWNLTANDLAVYFVPLRALIYTVSHVSMLLIISPMTVFYRRILDRPGSMALRSVNVVAAMLAFTTIGLHLSGVYCFAQSSLVMRLSVPLALVVLGAFLLVETVSLRDETARSLLVPATILAACAGFDALHLLLSQRSDNTWLLVGFLIFTVWMSIFGGRYVNQRFETALQSERLAIEVDAMSASLEKQRDLYQRFHETVEQTRRMRHDMRHQLSAIRGLVEADQNDDALQYIDELEQNTPSVSQLVLTENFVVNAVVSYYLAIATDSGIATDLQLAVPTDLGRINESDMSIVFGNLFENAIEASLHLPEEQRAIKMRSMVIGNNLTLTIDNAFDGNYEARDGVFYSRKRTGRGLGLSSVQSIVERYDGSMKIEIANNQFMVSLMVKL
jgi:signal transduction histidine kinase